MTQTTTAVVIGGGIAGPVTAIALRAAGIDATVYEAHPGGAEGVGAFLTLASNGIGALRTVDADARVLKVGFPTPEIILRSNTGKDLGCLTMGVPLADGTMSHTLKRADLYEAVRGEALSRRVAIEHGKRLTGVEESRDGVCALFDDGSEATCDILIGCDGVHSTVRRLIDPAAPRPTYSGLIGFGGYARDVAVDGKPGTYTMMFGKRAFFGYVIAPGDEVWWFANLPRRDEPVRGEMDATSPEEWRHTLLELFRDDAGPAAALVEASASSDTMKPTVIHSVPHLPKWHTDRTIVIGDAAHAPTPTSGQGASLAIEDAVVLAKCLRDVPESHKAFAAFESLRRERVERIIKDAARTNKTKAAGPIGRVVRDAMFPIVLKLMADSKRLKAPYEYSIDWNSRVVEQRLQTV